MMSRQKTTTRDVECRVMEEAICGLKPVWCLCLGFTDIGQEEATKVLTSSSLVQLESFE